MNRFTEKQVEAVLFGVAVGDALGVPVEFRPRGSFHVDDMIGHGTHNQPAGTWSDDTSLTLCLAEAMTCTQDFSGILNHTANSFMLWLEKGWFTAHGNVFDIGIATSKAISRLKAGVAPEQAGCTGANENGNGSLMRIAPLVFYLADRPEGERFKITKDVSSITHAHPWSVAACFIYLEYLLKLFNGKDKKAAYAELQEGFCSGNSCVDDKTLARFDRILKTDISTVPEDDIKSGGFVIDTLEAAFWCFLTTDNYRDAVLKAVNLGNDTDTTAAVTGGIAGAYYGFDDNGIPAEWVQRVAKRDYIFDIADKIANN